jgi:hypothetical protein
MRNYFGKRAGIGIYAGRIHESLSSRLSVGFMDDVARKVQIEVSMGFEPRG